MCGPRWRSGSSAPRKRRRSQAAIKKVLPFPRDRSSARRWPRNNDEEKPGRDTEIGDGSESKLLELRKGDRISRY